MAELHVQTQTKQFYMGCGLLIIYYSRLPGIYYYTHYYRKDNVVINNKPSSSSYRKDNNTVAHFNKNMI